ncbi:MAG: HDOD domain-containing protein [Gammaproteobacteria bacterium]|nr:HDOD domain-containing protein [Gammaproteobacteria bacterium]
MTAVDDSELQRFPALRSLSAEALHELKRNATVITGAARGKPLFTLRDTRPETFFLLAGSLRLERPDGTGFNLRAGEAAALQPLGAGHPGRLSATSLSPVRCLKVDADLLSVLQRADEPEDYAIDELHADDEEPDNRLLFRIYQDYIDDKLDIPQIPEISLRVRKAVEQPEVDIPMVARIIQADPALVARLVRVANSALYAGASPVGNIRDALVRLGLSVTRDLVTSFTLQHLFNTEHAMVKQRILKVWQHSTMVAAVSFILARLTRLYEPEHALLAGLLHDIGTATLLQQADTCEALAGNAKGLEEVVVKLRGQVGAMVLEKWGFSTDLVNVAREAYVWYRDDSPEHDLCDLVIVANLHCMGGDAEALGAPPMELVPAYRKLSLGDLTESQQLKILEDAKKEISEMRRLLLG